MADELRDDRLGRGPVVRAKEDGNVRGRGLDVVGDGAHEEGRARVKACVRVRL